MLRANAEGHVTGYGDDAWTEQACDRLRALFETDCAVFFVFSGTAANALALGHICRSYHAVIAHAESHVATDEAGATGFFSGGASLLTADTPLGQADAGGRRGAGERRQRHPQRQAARVVAHAGDRDGHSLFARRAARP